MFGNIFIYIFRNQYLYNLKFFYNGKLIICDRRNISDNMGHKLFRWLRYGRNNTYSFSNSNHCNTIKSYQESRLANSFFNLNIFLWKAGS